MLQKEKKKKPSNEPLFCRLKTPAEERGQRRMARLVWNDRKDTVNQITTLYNPVEQKSNSECTPCRYLIGLIGFQEQESEAKGGLTLTKTAQLKTGKRPGYIFTISNSFLLVPPLSFLSLFNSQEKEDFIYCKQNPYCPLKRTIINKNNLNK